MVIVLAALYAHFVNGYDGEKAFVAVIVGAGLCGLPDPKKGGTNTNIGASIAIFAIFATMLSCSKPPVTNTVETKDSTWITEDVKDHHFFVKKDSASLSIDLDDFGFALNSDVDKDSAISFTIVDVAPNAKLLNDKKKNIPGRKWTAKSNQASVAAEISKDGKRLDITGNCDSLAVLLQTKEKTIHHLQSKKSDSVKTVVEYKTHWYDIAARIIAGFYLVLLIITKIKI